jgi:hypothetical protein
MNRAEARIDVGHLSSNIAHLKSTSKTAIMAVVKADAYGHGLLGVGLSAEKAGADWLGVALLEEAITLRTHGVRIPILAWLVSPGSDFKAAVEHEIDIAVASIAAFKEIAQLPNKPRIHIELDTGMTRGGFLDEWQEFLLQDFSTVNIIGVFSHFARADEPGEKQNDEQLQRFNEMVADLGNLGINPPIKHLSNSAATHSLACLLFGGVETNFLNCLYMSNSSFFLALTISGCAERKSSELSNSIYLSPNNLPKSTLAFCTDCHFSLRIVSGTVRPPRWPRSTLRMADTSSLVLTIIIEVS